MTKFNKFDDLDASLIDFEYFRISIKRMIIAASCGIATTKLLADRSATFNASDFSEPRLANTII